MIVIDILAESLIGKGKYIAALRFDIFFVAGDDRIGYKMCFFVILYLFVADMLFISDEFSFVLLVLFEVFGIERLYCAHLLDGVYLT